MSHPSLFDDHLMSDLMQSDDDVSREAAWIEVIRKMDDTYADLVRYQVELEEKNSALEEAQRLIASVLVSMTDVLIVCDRQGAIQRVNAAFERLSGRKETEVSGIAVRALFAADSQPLIDGFAEVIRQDAIHDCELNLLGVDGSVPLAVNCSSRYDHRGRLIGMVLIGRPVGELRRAYETLNRTHEELKSAQQQLLHSEKMASLGRLVAGVAHELNNPISFVYGNVHAMKRYAERLQLYLLRVDERVEDAELLALRKDLRIDRIRDDLDSLIDGTLEGAERVRDIVQDLRQFSGSQELQADDFDLQALTRSAVHWVIRGSRNKPTVDFAFTGSMLVRGQAGQIHQVVMNMIQNAVDAMADQAEPKLEIRGRRQGHSIELCVRDHGPGIAAEVLPRIMEPFFTTKPVGQGTGLGLSISFGIARDHGGELRAGNHADGGAEFCLELPVRSDSS